MANLIIKSSADNLVLQGSDASPAITVGSTGTLTFAENVTMSGTANNLGTSTAGTLTSGITYPAGHVLQVVSTTKTDTFSQSNTNAWADITGLSVAITPAATSNKILITGVTYTGNVSGDVMTRIVRGSTAIGLGGSASSRTPATTGGSVRSSYEFSSHPFNFIDSPSTTSATTYKIQIFVGSAAYVNRTPDDSDNATGERVQSTITVMEIKA